MPFNIASYGGAQIFGYAVEVRPSPNPPALQISSYQGVNGQFCLFGGTRGGMIRIHGVMQDVSIPAVNADLAVITSYDDGIARTLIDCEGNVYFNCIYAGMHQPGPALITDIGWCKTFAVDFAVMSG